VKRRLCLPRCFSPPGNFHNETTGWSPFLVLILPGVEICLPDRTPDVLAPPCYSFALIFPLAASGENLLFSNLNHSRTDSSHRTKLISLPGSRLVFFPCPLLTGVFLLSVASLLIVCLFLGEYLAANSALPDPCKESESPGPCMIYSSSFDFDPCSRDFKTGTLLSDFLR